MHPQSTPSAPAGPDAIRAAAVRAWESALGVTGLVADADFFELGGDSMGGARVMATLRGQFGEGLPLTLIFFHPALDEFTEALTEAVGKLPASARPAGGAVRAEPAELPLSPEQEAQWVADQVTPGNLAYTELLSLRLSGPLDPERLQSAIDRLTERHEALRTRFPAGPDGRPVQEIRPAGAASRLTLTLRDARDEDEARAYALECLAEPFDLATGPLLRPHLVRLSATDHVFLLCSHHIVADGPTMEVLCAELATLYSGAEPTGPAPSYAQYTLQQQDRGLDAQLAYWRDQLAGAAELDLPLDRPRTDVRDTAGRRFRFTVPGAVKDGIDALAHEQRSTRFAVLLAAFQVLLGRWAGSEDVVVGSPVTSRSRPGLERMAGALVNMVAFRGDLSGDPTFRELLGRTRQACFAAMAHSDVPFGRVLTELALERDESRPPLFSTTLVSQPTPPALRADLGDVEGVHFPVPRRHAMYDFSLYVWESPRELLVDVEYATALFDESTAHRFADRFGALLEAVTTAPDRPLSALETVPAAELRQVLHEWNDTAADLGPDVCVHELVEEQARTTPDRTAVIAADHTLSYAELDAEAERLAARLRELGAGPETVVAVDLERSAQLVVTLLAVLKAGGAYLPLGPDWPARRKEFVLADAGAELLVDASGVRGCDGRTDRAPVPSDRRPDPGNLAYVLYTSGSTGTPKGVMIPHRAVVNRLRWMRRDCGLGAADVVLQNAVPTFDYAVWELFGPLHMGATVVLPSASGHRDFTELSALITGHGVTVAHFVPSLLRLFAEAPESARCDGLRVLFSGGEPLDPALAAKVQELLPRVRLFNAYGPTEAAVDVTCWPVPQRPGSVAIGGPAANTTCYVLDERMRPQPIGVPGELYLGGIQLARGYRGQPGTTGERFVPDPFGPAGGRLYRTGDRARWRPDGTLEYVDRVDRQVKIRGVRVEPGEAEAALLAHPAVREAAVVVSEGSGGPRLVAYHCGTPAGGEQELRDHLAARLPEFALPATYVELPGGLPVLSNGKLDRRALPAPERAGPAVVAAPGSTPPLGARELMLAALWSEVLGVDRISREDSFFELGGDSILGIQMVARARRAGIEVTVPALFRSPVLADLAAAVPAAGSDAGAGAQGGSGPVSVPAGSRARFPLTPLQREMLRESALAPGRGTYIVPAELLLEGEIDPETMRTAFRRLVERNPVLRTSVDPQRSEQVVHPATEPSFRYEDWSALSSEEQQRRRRDLLEEEWRTGFPPEATQLSRMIIIRLGARRSAMVWTRHNILLDGWSFAQLYDELLELHAALRGNRPEPPAAPRECFGSYVEWLGARQREAAERLWEEQLRELAPRTVFSPEVGPSPEPYGELRFPLPQQSEAFIRKHGLTISTLFEAAWAAVLARRTGTPDVQYGLVFSAREAEVHDVERILGLMINTLPSGLRLDPGQAVAGWLKEMQQRGARLKELAPADLGVLQQRAGTSGALWDTLLIIHNYPHNFQDVPAGGLRVVDTAGFSRVGAALIVSVDVKPLRLAMIYDAARAEEPVVRELAAELSEVLERMTASPDGRVGDLLG